MKCCCVSVFVIGVFVVGVLVVLVVVFVVLLGQNWFKQLQCVVMFFLGLVFGLQKGVLVVFCGVCVGDVIDISVCYESQIDSFVIFVVVEFDLDVVCGLEGCFSYDDIGYVLFMLIKCGLIVQFGMQSFVIGQFYVDLDFCSKLLGVLYGGDYGDVIEILISVIVFQVLKNQFESVDVCKIFDDLSQIVNVVCSFIMVFEFKQGMKDFVVIVGYVCCFVVQFDQCVVLLMCGVECVMVSVG